MKINEIFYSLQGEGRRAGEASIFIRLSGCDLSCSFCDTEFESGKRMSPSELLRTVQQLSNTCKWVVWTGGEPMTQLTEQTVKIFEVAGYKQAIETNGNHKVPFKVDWLTVSPKVAEHVLERNFPEGVDELRYPWHKGKLCVPQTKVKATHYYLSPIFDGNDPILENVKHCIKLCLKNPSWKISNQQHKVWSIL
jgi:7-carboxy-7-deazaguanine synthase